MDQDPPRQDPQRTFDNAHVLVQHQMMDIGAVEQCSDSRNQHDIVGANQFPQLPVLLCRLDATAARRCQALRALAALPRTFYCYISRIGRIGQMWRAAWRVFLPFQTPSGASTVKLGPLVPPPWGPL